MRIQGQPNDRIGPARGEKPESGVPAPAGSGDSGGAIVAASVDEVSSISDRVATARAEKVQELKVAVQSNRYHTDTAALAERILSDESARNTHFGKPE
ncbi:MAG: flagellar biosynthesis anti-sigma factor FlgM [Deltaproteobacteria bacterium]|nr:flagellar biosynthesis anti-sigma factor FlgM [Deltaproteobacteria bacterium]